MTTTSIVTTGRDLYPTRVESVPRTIPRRDPVIHGATPGPLGGEQLRSFEEDGFLAVESLFGPDEVAQLDATLRDLAERPDVRAREETILEPECDEVRSIFDILAMDEIYARLARDPRLLDVAQQLLGGDVYIHQSRANLKPAFSGRDFYWHSDFETWHAEDGMPRMRAISVSLSLTENQVFNGPLMLIPGSHRTFVPCVGETPPDHYKQSLQKQECGVPDQANLRALADRGGITTPVGPAGSAVFFDCNTMHGSSGNISPYPRRNLFLVYNSVENRLREPLCARAPRPEHVAHRGRGEVLVVGSVSSSDRETSIPPRHR